MSAAPDSPTRPATLRDLLPGSIPAGGPDAAAVTVTGLTLDSRDVRPGDLYLALPGRATHGLGHAAEAVARGAVAVATAPGTLAARADDAATLAAARTPDGRAAAVVEASGLVEGAGALASRVHGAPDRSMRLVAVTGTDGKTSVCRFIAGALAHLGIRAGYIGTIGWGVVGADGDGALAPSALTTPDVVTLRRMLAELRDAGCEVVALEASSHGIAEGRLDGLALEVGVLTNLGRDHLDYHGTVEAYAAAKARLFDVPGLASAVLNADDALGRSLVATLSARRVAGAPAPAIATFASRGGPDDRRGADVGGDADIGARDVLARDVVTGAHGLDFTLVERGHGIAVSSPLLGRFNVDNLLACHAVLRALGIDIERAAGALGALRPVPGRMERVVAPGTADRNRGPVVIVDYAHTPDALEQALAAARAHCDGRLHVVFGCGGDRDPGKRAPMAARAEAGADRVTLTDDNPRTEPSSRIIEDVLAGFADASRVGVVPDRRAAIEGAVAMAGEADVVLVAGKGHEAYQIVGTVRHAFSDRQVAAEALVRRAAVLGGGRIGVRGHARGDDGMSFVASLSDCEAALDATLVGDDTTVRGVGIDTRTLAPGALFVAVRGDRFDGHDFVAEAARRGAAALVVTREVDSPLPQLVVDDTLRALGDLARDWLRRHDVPVVAITGSNGKTTTREIVREILERLGPVLTTRGNLNNDFGVPLTLLRLGPEHRYAVIEMGASRAGDIERLCRICRPDVAVVTNTAAAHLEGFGDLEGVARAKGEIYRALGPHGHAVVNLDDPRAALLLEAAAGAEAGARLRSFGIGEDADVRGVPGPELRIDTLGTTLRARFALIGDHNGRNALAAVAAVQCLDVQDEAIIEGLEAVRAFPGRLQDRPGARGCRLIDDSYNANPASVRAAIDVLARLRGTRHLVLGEMLELGEDGERQHADIGRLARRRGIERLWTLGPVAGAAAAAFGVGATAFGDAASLARALHLSLGEMHVVLVKGSRGSRMERVVEALGADAPVPVEAEPVEAEPVKARSVDAGPVVPTGRLKGRHHRRSSWGTAS